MRHCIRKHDSCVHVYIIDSDTNHITDLDIHYITNLATLNITDLDKH